MKAIAFWRRPTPRWPLAAAVAAGLACTAQVPREVPEAAPAPRVDLTRVDHHVHLLGPGLLRDWKAIGATFSRPDEAYLTARAVLGPPPGGDPEAFLTHAVLVPMAHFYGSEEMRGELGLSQEAERAAVAAENDHVAREAARYPGRAVALCSVPALRPYALEELERCRRDLHSAGVKLHFGSSGVDLREPEHLRRAAEIFAWADSAALPVLLHLDPQRRGHVVSDIGHFARAVLEPHPRLTVIVAHLGGSGGYGPWTRSVFRSLVEWLEALEAAGEARRAVYFDLSAVVLAKASEGVPATTTEEARQLGADLRAAGLERILFGSDYPVFDPRGTAQALAERVGLTDTEMTALMARRAPNLFSNP